MAGWAGWLRWLDGAMATTTAPVLDLSLDPVTLTERLVDIESVSGGEGPIADAVESALAALPNLRLARHGNTVVARTELGRDDRVVVAGHLDTVPVNANLPARRDEHAVHGLGSCDMKGGVAVALHLAASVHGPVRDVTYVFYDCEEVEAERNGLGRLATRHPDLLEADFAILMEPSAGAVEAGCQGTLRVDVTTRGVRAHSARSWTGRNAIHAAAPVLQRLAEYQPRRPVIDGLTYHEGLNAVGINGGVAGNVLPDLCTVSVNHRFAPDRSEDEALAFVRDYLDGYEVTPRDSAPGALPGLAVPAAAAFVEAVGGPVNPKFGWTDVARFSAVGVPAVNYGPGDPHLAHRQDEHVPIAQVEAVAARLRAWLTGG
jgi:succinyl-diaminopimelate desuccinylase